MTTIFIRNKFLKAKKTAMASHLFSRGPFLERLIDLQAQNHIFKSKSQEN